MHDDDIRGWKDIATHLGGVHVDTAQEYAKRNRDPLPVFADHRGVVIRASSLRDWVERQRVAYARSCAEKAARRSIPARIRKLRHRVANQAKA